MIELELARLVINERSEEQLLTLRERGGPRSFSLSIGLFEAAALQRAIDEEFSPRPLTHELLRGVLTVLDAELSGVTIDDVRDSVFYAKLRIRHGGREHLVDARPTDALTLALQAEVPIHATERVLRLAAGE